MRALLLRDASCDSHNEVGLPLFEGNHPAQKTEGLLFSLRPHGACIDQDEIGVIGAVRGKEMGIHQDLTQVI